MFQAGKLALRFEGAISQKRRQRKYRVTLRHVRATIFAVEKQRVLYILSVCICSFRYPACNAHAPYCHLSPARLYNIFPHYLINRTIFLKKKLLDTKCELWFSLRLSSETFLILRRTEWEIIKNVYWYHLFLFDFNDTWISSTDFRKILKYQISWKSVQWEQSCPMRMDGRTVVRTDGRTDRRTDMIKLIVAFRNFANAPHKKCPNLLAISFHQELPKQFNSCYLYHGRPTFYDREQQPLL
jgi:hypothetical protein